jgi:hypothetical protein
VQEVLPGERDEVEVRATVAVVVEPGRFEQLRVALETGALDLLEAAPLDLTQQARATEVGREQQIRPLVSVEVGPQRLVGLVAGSVEPRVERHVDERAVPRVAIESQSALSGDDGDVRQSITVVVAPGEA